MKKRLGGRRKRWEPWLVVACIPVVLLLHLLRPIFWVRFGWLQTHKLGHILLEPEFYLLGRAAGIQPRRSFDLFFDRNRGDGITCNTQAQAMVARQIRIRPWVKYLWKANKRFPGADRHVVHIKPRDQDSVRDKDGLFDRFPVQIDFTPEERNRGRALLAEIGVPEGNPFVCVHVRNPLYWKSPDPGIGENSDFRNSDIAQFIPAIKSLVERGYYVLRVGFPAAARIDIGDPRFIDYSSRFRSEFMDIYLGANCHFMVSTGSGIDSVSYMFRRPILMCNLAPIGCLFSDKPWIVNLPKLHRRSGSAALMGFADVIASGAAEFVNTQQFHEAGIEFLDSPAEVIQEAVLEMADRIDGTWRDNPEDERLQRAFWQLFENHPFHGRISGHISTAYLRAFRELI